MVSGLDQLYAQTRARVQSIRTARDHVAQADPAMLAAHLSRSYVRRSHLDLIARGFVRMARGEIDRLLIATPPQIGKSETAAVWGALWWMIHHPHHRGVVASYADGLAIRRGKSVRGLVAEHGHRYGLALDMSSRAANDWSLLTGGGIRSVGVGSGLTGHSAHLLICDDPHKDRIEADSLRIRDNIWDWWSSTAMTRLAPGAPVCLIQCTVAHMRVLRGDGRWVMIKDIAPGDQVVSLAEDRESLRTATVTASRLSGYADTYTVRTQRHALTVNARHPFAVLNRNRRRPLARDLEWVHAAHIRPGDIVATVKSLPDDHEPLDVLPNGEPVDEQRAWLLGYLLGDGWVTTHRRKNQQGNPTSYAVCCAQGTSKQPEKKDLPERIFAALDAWSPNKVYSTKYGYWRTDWAAGGRVLDAMGYGNGAAGKRVPDCVWGWSPYLRRAFLFGYVEADGSKQRANWSKSHRVGSVSRELLEDAHDLALTCGVRPTTVTTEKPYLHRLPEGRGSVMTYGHSLGLAFLPDQAEKTSLLSESKHPDPRHLRYERVTSVEHDPLELPVYDLTVAGTETFCAEGFLVHNTRWHEDDLAGRLLDLEGDSRDGGRWHVLNLPAFATSDDDPLDRAVGDPLPHPALPPDDLQRLSEHWRDKKATMTVRDWNALCMGDPQPAEGALVSESLLRHQTHVPIPAQAQKTAVAVDPSGGGRDTAGIIGGSLCADGRLYLTHDATIVGPTEQWSRAAVHLAAEIDADVIVYESNYGGDQVKWAIQSAWERAQRENPHDERFQRIAPRLEDRKARKNKLLRAEPIAQQFIEDRLRLGAGMGDLVHEWTHWQPTNPDSPGRIDASVYLAYFLLPIPGEQAVISTPTGVQRQQFGSRRGPQIQRAGY